MSHVLWRWWSGCCPGDGSICETTVGYSRKCDTAKKRCDTASQKRLSVSGNGPDENGELTTGKSGSRRTSWGSPSFRKTPCDETGAFLRFSENPKVDILGVSSFEVLLLPLVHIYRPVYGLLLPIIIYQGVVLGLLLTRLHLTCLLSVEIIRGGGWN